VPRLPRGARTLCTEAASARGYVMEQFRTIILLQVLGGIVRHVDEVAPGKSALSEMPDFRRVLLQKIAQLQGIKQRMERIKEH
jgi:hypothetical protein